MKSLSLIFLQEYLMFFEFTDKMKLLKDYFLGGPELIKKLLY